MRFWFSEVGDGIREVVPSELRAVWKTDPALEVPKRQNYQESEGAAQDLMEDSIVSPAPS